LKLKDVIIVLSLVAFFIWLDKTLSKHNYDLTCLIELKTYTGESLSIENSVAVNDTVYIKGLGNFNQSDLIKSKEILEDEFGVVCKIDGSVSTDKDFYTNDGLFLDEERCFTKLKSNNRVVYITNEGLYSSDDNKKLKGSSLNSSPNMIVRTKTLKKTLLHEFGHSLGLHHCDNKVCVMGVHNSNITNNEFCNNCSKKLNR
jgi:hypothetical protein